MRVGGIWIALLTVVVLCGGAHGQYQPPSDRLWVTGERAATWQEGGANAVLIEGSGAAGGVTIEVDRGKMTADNAVVWLEPAPAEERMLDEQLATVALLGHAQVQQPDVTRSGDRLLVTAKVRGNIRITANERAARDLSDSALYRQALELRKSTAGGELGAGGAIGTTEPTTNPLAATAPTTGPTTKAARRTAPVLFNGTFQNITSSDGKLAVLFTDGVTLSRMDPKGKNLEIQAQRAVLFTTLVRARDVMQMQQISAIEDAITAAYLEGDVRISVSQGDVALPEQRLSAERVYYEFTTDRAILTDAVIRTMDPKAIIPVIVRAETVRQLSEGEFRATHTELTTSSFAVPSYSMRASKAYVREIPTGDPRYGTMTEFYANDVTLRAFGLPYFYLPAVGGEFTERGFPLRNIIFGNSTRYGFGVKTEWGLLEALGILPPPDVDANLRLDYFGERGPGFGVDVDYGGGYVTQTSKQPWNFQGTFKTYFVPQDQGIDDLGRRRVDLAPTETFRGRIRWEHQQFLPNDWQVQLRTGWVSDPNFLEEWFEPEFNDGPPLESSFYAKKQRDSEALTLLVTMQPNNIVTTSNLYQETVGPIIPGLFQPTAANKPFEIERLPEIGYHRIGENLGDRMTLFSDNVFSGLRYNAGVAALGFVPPNGESLGFRSPNRNFPEGVLPGIPAQGTTGTTSEWIYRGDFREEVDFPFGAGQLRFLPYVIGRYTGYTDSPNVGQLNRFYTGAGVRINTAFWKIDNSVESELLDIHRVRHVIEPELHLFTSAATEDRSDPFIYDMDVDAINDVSAVSGGLRQRWQTKRGGPGNERSVDFFTLNMNATFYANKPPGDVMPPSDFRGLFFNTLPEASIPRDSFNGEALWRVTNSTAIIADASYNIVAGNLATAGIGLAARRGERIGFFVGTRYIEDLNSAITTVAFQYQLTTKYSVVGRWSFDFGDQEQVYTSISVQRKFDRFFMVLTVYDDAVNNNSGFGFAIYPEGFGRGLSTDELAGAFGKR